MTRPHLRPGEQTVVVRTRIAAPDRALLERAATASGETVSDLLRRAAVIDACHVLGIDLDAWVERREEAPPG